MPGWSIPQDRHARMGTLQSPLQGALRFGSSATLPLLGNRVGREGEFYTLPDHRSVISGRGPAAAGETSTGSSRPTVRCWPSRHLPAPV
jgi:hypothetical protein